MRQRVGSVLVLVLVVLAGGCGPDPVTARRPLPGTIARPDAAAAVSAGTIEPGGLLVIGQSLDASKNGGAPVGAAYGTHLILNNDAEAVSICLGACATGVVLDQVGWEAIGAGYDGHALIVESA